MNWNFCLIKSIAIASIIMLLSACAQRQQNLNIDTANLSQLENVRVQPLAANGDDSTGLSRLRSKSLRDSAMSIGAQGGLAWASGQMNTNLDKDYKYLDSIYNFNAMVLSHGVLPPILEQGDNSLNLADTSTIRIADRTYKIIAQARFATTPPNWREYLLMNYSKPELPDKTLLPKSAEEQKIWKEGIESGWQKGIEQSYSIFQQNLARLKRDYNGMILYRKLLQEKMISAPFVARTELGITGNGEDMRVNDQVLRIVELPKLQTNSKEWHAVVVKQNG
jgi:defect-in-organelle-trafficking protein DotC